MTIQHIVVILLSVILLSSCTQKQETNETTQPIAEKKIIKAIVIQPQAERDTLKGSLKALVTGKIGSTVITINYYSPAVRGRVIWSGLVPMDQVWVTGAHKATSIEFEGPLKVGDVDLPAGKYGFFTIPSKEEWTIIIFLVILVS